MNVSHDTLWTGTHVQGDMVPSNNRQMWGYLLWREAKCLARRTPAEDCKGLWQPTSTDTLSCVSIHPLSVLRKVVFSNTTLCIDQSSSIKTCVHTTITQWTTKLQDSTNCLVQGRAALLEETIACTTPCTECGTLLSTPTQDIHFQFVLSTSIHNGATTCYKPPQMYVSMLWNQKSTTHNLHAHMHTHINIRILVYTCTQADTHTH